MLLIKPIPATLQRKSLRDYVYASIRDSIVTVKLEPGRMLYENELADMLGVSRTPIREAIRLLASEQLIEVLPQKGTRIALISQRKVNEVQFIREQLETGAFQLAATLWDPIAHQSIKREIEEIMLNQQAAAQANDLVRFFELDERFHHAVMMVTGNETLLTIIAQMRAHLNRVRYLSLQKHHHMDRIIQEHVGLLEAIERNDAAASIQLLRAHIGRFGHAVTELRTTYPQFFSK